MAELGETLKTKEALIRVMSIIYRSANSVINQPLAFNRRRKTISDLKRMYQNVFMVRSFFLLINVTTHSIILIFSLINDAAVSMFGVKDLSPIHF